LPQRLSWRFVCAASLSDCGVFSVKLNQHRERGSNQFMTPPLLPAYMIARWLLLIIAVAGLYFLQDFLVPVLAALIIGLASWPRYQQLVASCGHRRSLAATLALLIVLVVLVVPLGIALNFAIQEASSFIRWALAAN